MGDAAQLDLVVVGHQQLTTGGGNESLAELAAFLAAHRDVVQVGLIAGQSAGAGHRLVERRMDSTVGGDLGEQAGAVGAAQLLHLAIGQQRVDELGPLVAQFLQRGRIGGEAGLGLLAGRKAALGEQDLAQLDGRVDVERTTHHLLQHSPEALDLGGELAVELGELGNVDGDAHVLHLRQHADQRVLDGGVQLGHALLVERSLQSSRQVRDSKCLAGRDPSFVGAAAEVELAARRGTIVG